MSAKQKRTPGELPGDLRRQREAEAFARILITLAAAAAATLLTQLVYQGAFSASDSARGTWQWALALWAGVGLLALGGALLWVFGRLRPSATGRFAAAAGLCVGAVSLCLAFVSRRGAAAFCLACPLAGLLALIFLLYRTAFFLNCLNAAAAILTMMALRLQLTALRNPAKPLAALSIVLALGSLLLAFLCKRQRGKLKLGKRILRVFDREDGYATVYIGALLSGLSCAVSLLLSAYQGYVYSYILLCVLAAYVFIAAVYHTVRLM